VTGTVKNSLGKPLEGICITQHDFNEGVWGRRTGLTTDAKGHYLTYKISGDKTILEFWDCHQQPAYAGLIKRGVPLYAGHVTTLNVTLGPGASVTGRLLDSGGTPITTVCAQAFDGRNDVMHYFSIYEVKPGADGRFTIGGLTPGSIRLRFACPDSYVRVWYDNVPATEDYAGDYPNATAISVQGGQTTDIHDITLQHT
jgi:hypothetical protein